MSFLRLRAILQLRPATGVGRFRTLSSTVHGNNPDLLQKEKSRNLSGTQDSSAPHKDQAPGWNEQLAADQSGPMGKPGKELQDQTIEHTRKHHHSLEGDKGAEAHRAKHNPEQTGSEEAIRADQGA